MGGKIKKVITSFLELILVMVAFVIFLLVILPIIGALFVPLYAWRWILIGITKMFRPDVWKILGGKNPVLALDDIHGRPLCTIVGMGVFGEGFNVTVANNYVINIVNALNTKTGGFLHPELRHYYTKWLGYFWWHPEKNFSVEDHVKIYQNEENGNEVICEDDFMKIVADLESRPFPEKKSPWEVLLIQNCLFSGGKDPEKGNKFVYLFRFHHGLADGISVMQVFMQYVFDGDINRVAKPVIVERNSYQKLARKIMAGIQLPYQFCKQGLTSMDVNAWHLKEEKLTRKIHKAWSSRIQIDVIKEIKRRYQVGFTAVLVCVISGAIGKMMKKYDVPVPRKMHAILPLPWPKHPHKFCNHWSYGFLPLPVGISDGRCRLIKSHKYIEKLKVSANPYVNFAILNFFNLLPTWIIEQATVTNYLPSVILSNFPGPPSESEGLGGFPLLDSMFTGGPLRGNIGISVTILSYNGALRIVAGVDSAIFPKHDMAKEFIEIIQQEFLLLKAEEIV